LPVLATTAQDQFGTVIVIVVVVSAVVALVAFAGARRVYDQIGRGGLSINEDDDGRARPASAPSGPAAAAEREAEIRQLLAARNVHRVRRGQAPLDVEDELRTQLAPTVDPQLAAEVRQLVIARNARRERQGKPPLDVEEEVARQLRDLG
jgi:Tfp pilus assembly protein PilX